MLLLDELLLLLGDLAEETVGLSVTNGSTKLALAGLWPSMSHPTPAKWRQGSAEGPEDHGNSRLSCSQATLRDMGRETG